MFRCAAIGHVRCDDGRPSLAPAIVQLAHTLGLPTIAEGVESQDQATPLRDLQCRLAQGSSVCRWTRSRPRTCFALAS